jgi:phosphoribosylformylglycinamidine cyclo-ligase
MKTYKESGVDVKAADRFLHSNQLDNLVETYSMSGRLVFSCDGVGTKLIVARELEDYSTIGQDLVAMNANDLLVKGAKSAVFMDYIATGDINNPHLDDIITSISDTCKNIGCTLVGGETAEMPDMYGRRDIDLAGFAVGEKERNWHTKVEEGQLLFGLPSSGIHSNGLSLARKVLANRFDLLLTPTKIYNWNEVKDKSIFAASHITGGGLLGRLEKMLTPHVDIHLEDLSKYRLPIFDTIQEVGNISTAEMYHTFNMGIGFVVATTDQWANQFKDWFYLGHTTTGEGKCHY